MAGSKRLKMGAEMRLFAVVAVLCAICQTAAAQTQNCKAVTDSSARLACYDKVAPPARAKPPSQVAPAANVDAPKHVDTISAEDALMNARLKNICRGC
jgi:hypothetical protein